MQPPLDPQQEFRSACQSGDLAKIFRYWQEISDQSVADQELQNAIENGKLSVVDLLIQLAPPPNLTYIIEQCLIQRQPLVLEKVIAKAQLDANYNVDALETWLRNEDGDMEHQLRAFLIALELHKESRDSYDL